MGSHVCYERILDHYLSRPPYSFLSLGLYPWPSNRDLKLYTLPHRINKLTPHKHCRVWLLLLP